MIDLSKFVDKQVCVTFMNGCICEGKITRNSTGLPYCFKCNEGDYECDYTYDGFEIGCDEPTAGDIDKIEELNLMNKYEELEKQVAEMQKEIDRLKREEKKYPDLKPVEVIRTVRFTPEEYFKHCEENEFEVTEEGYEEFYTDSDILNDCFFYNNACTQEIKVMEN